MSYYYSFNLPITIIRPFNTFGPRQSLRAVIPTIINQVIGNKKIKLGNLNTKRNFNFIGDIVNGFELAIKSNKKTNGEVINLGSNYEISILKLTDLILKITNRQIIIKQDKIRGKAKR